jgi:hypothetical protein
MSLAPISTAAAEGCESFISTGTHKGGLSAIPGYQPRIPANGKFTHIEEGVIDPDKMQVGQTKECH